MKPGTFLFPNKTIPNSLTFKLYLTHTYTYRPPTRLYFWIRLHTSPDAERVYHEIVPPSVIDLVAAQRLCMCKRQIWSEKLISA